MPGRRRKRLNFSSKLDKHSLICAAADTTWRVTNKSLCVRFRDQKHGKQPGSGNGYNSDVAPTSDDLLTEVTMYGAERSSDTARLIPKGNLERFCVWNHVEP